MGETVRWAQKVPENIFPGQLIAPGQLTDPRVNFASVHGLTPIQVYVPQKSMVPQNIHRY